MPKYEIVPATEAHAVALAKVMAEADKQEVWAMGHSTPIQALQRALKVSRDAKTGLADGREVCMFGVVPPSLLSNIGVPWLLTAVELPQHGTKFLRESRATFDGWRREYEVLANYVDARHKTAIRWLDWLGFTIDVAEPFGVEKLPFHRFHVGD